MGDFLPRIGEWSAKRIDAAFKDLSNQLGKYLLSAGRPGGQSIVASTDEDQWLGIGVDPPLTKLHVDGSLNGSNELRVSNANAGASANVRARLQAQTATLLAGADSGASASTLAGITIASWSFMATTAGNGLILGSTNSTPLVLMTGNTERARIEADGTVKLYQTVASSSTFTKTADTTLAAVTGLAFNVAAGRTYRFLAELHIDAPAAGGYKLAVGGTATATSYISWLEVHSNAPALTLASRSVVFGVGAGVTAAITGRALVSGVVTVNAAGTLAPLFAQNAASGASTVAAGSSFQIWPV